MPQLRVLKNAEPFCIVGSDDVRAFSLSVWADLWGPERSLVAVSGRSKRGSSGHDGFLAWALPVELAADAILDVHFEEGSVSMPGAEPIRRAGAETPEDAARFESRAPSEAELREWEARPAMNERLRWHVSINGDPPARIGPTRDAQHLSLELQWDDAYPDRMRVTLAASSLHEMVRGRRARMHFDEHVALGSHVAIAILE